MIDILKRSLVVLVSWTVAVYVISLLSQWIVMVQTEYLGMNIVAGLAVIVLSLYMMTIYGVYPLHHTMQKRILWVLGLLAIVVGHFIFANDAASNIYVWDIIKLFGVLIIWFGATWILTKNKIIESQKREKSLEIIEA